MVINLVKMATDQAKTDNPVKMVNPEMVNLAVNPANQVNQLVNLLLVVNPLLPVNLLQLLPVNLLQLQLLVQPQLQAQLVNLPLTLAKQLVKTPPTPAKQLVKELVKSVKTPVTPPRPPLWVPLQVDVDVAIRLHRLLKRLKAAVRHHPRLRPHHLPPARLRPISLHHHHLKPRKRILAAHRAQPKLPR